MKQCKTCLDTKPFDSYYRSNRTSDGYRGTCKSCQKLSNKKRYEDKKRGVGHNQGNIPMPSQDELRGMFSYNCDGTFSRIKPSGNQKAGSLAKGKIEKHGYIRFYVSSNYYLMHRIIWKWHHGTEPEFIDHINGNRADNRIENLRECTKPQNAANRSLNCNNTSGFIGISWHKPRGLWALKTHSKLFDERTLYIESIESAVYHFCLDRFTAYGDFAMSQIKHNLSALQD